jgi:tetratricopeptide (TPR) repeat protein
MNLTRIEQLLKFLEEDPNDVFSLYALALEYKNEQPAEALQLLNQLLVTHPDYLPAYYQTAALMQENGEIKDALKLYEAGIELARKQNNLATLRELQAAHELLLEDQ